VVVVVVVGFVVVPTSEFGFQKCAEPFGEGPILLDDY
jgi:hypothetical protein